MRPIFDQDHQALQSFNRFFRENAESLLRIVAFEGRDEREFFIKGEFTATYFSCTEEEKLRLEVVRWCKALTGVLREPPDPEPLKRMSPTLYNVHMAHNPREVREQVLVRALRMVLLFEALFLRENHCSPDNPYWQAAQACLQHAEAGPAIKRLVDVVAGATHPLLYDDPSGSDREGAACQISLPLLLLVAIAEGQCEHLQNFAWETYSAGHVRDGLIRQWGANDELSKVVNTAALIVRCQSLVGQERRGNGSDAFLELVGWWRGTDAPLAFTVDERLQALRLTAVIEEARNQWVPSTTRAKSRWRTIDIDLGVDDDRRWNQQSFCQEAAKYAGYEPPSAPPVHEPTYAYWRPQYLGLSDCEEGRRALDRFTQTLWSVP